VDGCKYWDDGAEAYWDPDALRHCADVASRLHRLAKGCADANGYADVDSRTCAAFRERIDKQAAKLSAELAPFGLSCSRTTHGYPVPLMLYAIADATPVPTNGLEGMCGGKGWGIGA
jgi:hypothetical protein